MSVTHGMHKKEKKIQEFWKENKQKTDEMEDLCIDEKIISKLISKI